MHPIHKCSYVHFMYEHFMYDNPWITIETAHVNCIISNLLLLSFLMETSKYNQ